MLERALTSRGSIPEPEPVPSAPEGTRTAGERTAAAPRESEARYRAVYENIPLMVFTLDGDGTVLSVNEHSTRELGYGSEELVGRSVLEVFHPEDRPAAARQLGWALEFPEDVARWELRKVRKDGSVLWVRETVRILPVENAPPEILVVCEDVTERRRAVRRLAETRDELRELNADLSRAEEDERRRIACVLHDEAGQTLAAARMAVCELRDSEASEVRAGRLDELRVQIERSIEVTRTLAFQLSPPILYDLGLAAAVHALGERMEAHHGVRFAFELGEGWRPPPEETGVVLYRVVRELLHNVAKHARASRVRIELGGASDEVRLVVEDDGMGFNVPAAGRSPAGHAGRSLGLFHVKERMERLGGRFEIDSAPGRGTRAALRLPVTEQVVPDRSDGRGSP